MGRATQTVIKTTKVRRKKIPDGNVVCNICHGKGYHKAPKRKKK